MPNQFSGILTSIYEGADTSRTRRWMAADYVDRVLLAASGEPVLFWPAGAARARLLPGLADTEGYDGVEVFDDHVMLWRRSTLSWSARSDFSLWIPVLVTAAYGRAELESDFTMTAYGSASGHAYLTNLAGEFVVNQFVRVVSYEDSIEQITYDYFRVRSVSSAAVINAFSIKRDQSVAPGETKRIYLGRYDTYVDWTAGARLTINGVSATLRVTNRSRNANYSKLTTAATGAIPAVGGTLALPFDYVPTEMFAGDVLSVGRADEPGLDLYQVKLPPSLLVTTTRLTSEGTVAGVVYAAQTYVSFQNWVEVTNTGTSNVSIPSESAVSVVSSLVLEPLGLTGGTAVGAKLPAGAIVESIDANEAGSVENVGALINGDIFGCVTLGEFCYILKKRSIQSIQSVGQAAGTLFIRPEILDEGPVGRYAWCRSSDREVVFIGSKNIYVYGGGQNLRPIAQQHWFAFSAEVDWSRADEIVAHHNRRQNEVWFSYPATTGDVRVLIYNYIENSVVIDKYTESISGLTALGRVDWELAPTWESLPPSERCNGTAKRWYEYIDVPEREYTIMAVAGDSGTIALGENPDNQYSRLLVHGRVWSRTMHDDCAPTAVPSFVETIDYDFGSPELWKYVDTVYLSLWGRPNVPAGASIEVTIGARDNLLSPIRWGTAQTLPVDAAGSAPTKINSTVSGRYIRLRFSSATVGANWGITGWTITARKGGNY